MSEKERYITEILGRLLKKHYPGGSGQAGCGDGRDWG